MLWNRKKEIEMCCECRYMKENVCEICGDFFRPVSCKRVIIVVMNILEN